MFYEGPSSQRGAGIGSLFTGLFREMMPISKINTKDLNKINNNKVIKKEIKKAAKNILKAKKLTKAVLNSSMNSLNNKPKTTKKRKIQKNLKTIPHAKKRKINAHLNEPKRKKPLIDDDDY